MTPKLATILVTRTGAVADPMTQPSSAKVVGFADGGGRTCAHGLMTHDTLPHQIKTPEEAHKPWDYHKLRTTIPAGQAFAPLSGSTCQLVAK